MTHSLLARRKINTTRLAGLLSLVALSWLAVHVAASFRDAEPQPGELNSAVHVTAHSYSSTVTDNKELHVGNLNSVISHSGHYRRLLDDLAAAN